MHLESVTMFIAGKPIKRTLYKRQQSRRIDNIEGGAALSVATVNATILMLLLLLHVLMSFAITVFSTTK